MGREALGGLHNSVSSLPSDLQESTVLSCPVDPELLLTSTGGCLEENLGKTHLNKGKRLKDNSKDVDVQACQ